MKKQNRIRFTVFIIVMLLTANGCSGTKPSVFYEEAVSTAPLPETVSETIVQPTLTIDSTVLEIGYNTPLILQGNIPIRHPAPAGLMAEPSTQEETDAIRMSESECYDRKPVTIHFATENVTSCSYSLEALERTSRWEEDYGENAALAKDEVYAQNQENIAAGYMICDGQILFERLGAYEIIIQAEGTDGTVLTESILVTVIDDMPPILHVPKEISFTAGEDWTSFLTECSAEDEIDGNLYGSIVFQDEKNHPFDPEIPGEYLLRFSVKDYAGNEAAVVSQVIVVEKEAASPVSNVSNSNNRRTGTDSIPNRSPAETAAPAENNVSSETISDNTEPAAPPRPVETQPSVNVPVPAETLPPETLPSETPPEEIPPTQAATEAPLPETEPPAEISEYLDGGAIVDLINNARTEAGLGVVSWEGGLFDLAQVRASEQSIKTGHERPDGSHIVQYYGMGECTAWGYSSVQAVFDAWMASENHRAAILWETHTKCCMAGYKDSAGIYWVLILE